MKRKKIVTRQEVVLMLINTIDNLNKDIEHLTQIAENILNKKLEV